MTMSNAQHASVHEALARVSAELKSLSVSTERLQDAIGDLIADNARLTSDAIVKLQDIDRLKQTLSDLARFVSDISDAAPTENHVDIQEATQCLALHDLAARLRGETAGADAHDEDEAFLVGECELFD